MREWRSAARVFHGHSSSCFLRQCLSLNHKFTASASLAAQRTPQILLPLPSPPCWITDMRCHVWLLCGYWGTTQVSYLDTNQLRLLPGPRMCIFNSEFKPLSLCFLSVWVSFPAIWFSVLCLSCWDLICEALCVS